MTGRQTIDKIEPANLVFFSIWNFKKINRQGTMIIRSYYSMPDMYHSKILSQKSCCNYESKHLVLFPTFLISPVLNVI